MNADRWQKIDKLFQACLELEPDRRAAFLDEACAGDRRLREKIETLLVADAESWSFVEHPAIEMAAPLIATYSPPLETGHRIAQYEIVDLIGRGGMGEVYLARDEILNRLIALKFLPVDYTEDKDRLQRFHREAKAASALNHPGILTIHQLGDFDGRQFIATEFIEGETLRHRLSQGASTPAEATEVAIQVTSALAAAHKAGIVHRDIKPENIMLRPDGYVKVLDFGLAKLAEPAEPLSEATGAELTDVSSGLLMGTLRYMSPEQARGLPVDQRTDIFSLGVVLYEMLTGRPPFGDKDPAKLIQSILNDEQPALTDYDWLPETLAVIVTKCLSKERNSRYQQASDLLADLKLLKDELGIGVKRSARETARAGDQRLQLARGASTNEGLPRPTRTLDSISNHLRRPRLLIALIVLLPVGSVLAYASYKLLRAPSIDSSAAKPADQIGSWTPKASLSAARANAEPAVLNGVLYVAGGWNVCTPFANLEAYDLATDTWSQRAPMLTARGNHGVGVLNGLLYAVGGSVDCAVETAAVEAYDPASNTWSNRAALPTKRTNHVVAVANGKLYAIGGHSEEAGTLGLNSEYDPQTDKWIERAPMPTPRHSAAAVVMNDNIYVIGGADRALLPTVEVYDPVTNSWTSRKPMLAGRWHFAATVLKGVIYVLGGVGERLEVEAYNPLIDTWSVVAQLPTRRAEFHAITVGSSIYFAGGTDGATYLSSVMAFTPELISQSEPAKCPRSEVTAKAPMLTGRHGMAVGEAGGMIYVVGGFQRKSVASNEAYDPVADKWTVKAAMPTARELGSTSSAVVDGKLYVIGGNSRGKCTNANEAYDPATDTWTTRAPMPTPRCHLAVVALDGLIYALGGTNTSGSVMYATVEIYNPSTDAWTVGVPMPTARIHFGTVPLNGKLYAAGGWNLEFTPADLNVLEAYDPVSQTWSKKATLPSQRSALAAGVLNGLLIAVGGKTNSVPVATVEAYDPVSDTWTPLTALPSPRSYLSAVTLNNTLYAVGGMSPSFPDSTTVNEALNVWPCSGR